MYFTIEKGYSLHEYFSKSTTDCQILSQITTKIQNQLNTIFASNAPVGPITLTVANQKIQGPPSSDFTQSLSSIALPSYLAFNSQQASLINPKSTWSNIFVSTSQGGTNPLLLNLTKQVSKVVSTTGPPVCSNVFLTVTSMSIGGITLADFNKLTLNTTQPSSCTSASQNFSQKKSINYPFSLASNMSINVPITAQGTGRSSFCGGFSPNCDNPFESCFYQDHCNNNLNVPCNDQIQLTTVNASGSISGTVVLTITGNITFQESVSNSVLTISDISLINTSYTLSPSITANINVKYDILSLIGGEAQVKANLMKYVDQVFQKLVPGVISLLNSYLAKQTLTFPL